jgi:hypothetical protein
MQVARRFCWWAAPLALRTKRESRRVSRRSFPRFYSVPARRLLPGAKVRLSPAGEPEVQKMKAAKLATLKFFALLFLLPGLAGLIVSAMISTHYLDIMPRWPVPEEHRMVPRGIHGVTVYQTSAEDRALDAIEYSSVGVFLVGLALGLVYLEKWGSLQIPFGEEDSELTENPC